MIICEIEISEIREVSNLWRKGSNTIVSEIEMSEIREVF